MRDTAFPEPYHVLLPRGTKAKLRETALAEGTTAAEFTRRAIRAALADAAAEDRRRLARSA